MAPPIVPEVIPKEYQQSTDTSVNRQSGAGCSDRRVVFGRRNGMLIYGGWLIDDL